MSEKLIEIDCSVNKTISYSMQQNHIQAIRRVRIRNNTDRAFEGLDLRIGFSPEFALPFSTGISVLEAGERLELNDLVIPLNSEYLMSLTEKEQKKVEELQRLESEKAEQKKVEDFLKKFKTSEDVFEDFKDKKVKFLTPVEQQILNKFNLSKSEIEEKLHEVNNV